MAYLLPECLQLTGGCHCKSVRYTIDIPPVEQRPLIPGAVDVQVQRSNAAKDSDIRVPTRVPVIGTDQCGDCRHAAGAIAQCWLILPHDWVKWTFSRGPGTERIGAEQTIAASSALTGLQTFTGETRQDGEQNPAASYLTHYRSSPGVTRTFCKRCGTNLTYFKQKDVEMPFPPLVDIAVGSLDDDCQSLAQPERHSWWDHGILWVKDMLRNGRDVTLHSDGNITQKIEG